MGLPPPPAPSFSLPPPSPAAFPPENIDPKARSSFDSRSLGVSLPFAPPPLPVSSTLFVFMTVPALCVFFLAVPSLRELFTLPRATHNDTDDDNTRRTSRRDGDTDECRRRLVAILPRIFLSSSCLLLLPGTRRRLAAPTVVSLDFSPVWFFFSFLQGKIYILVVSYLRIILYYHRMLFKFSAERPHTNESTRKIPYQAISSRAGGARGFYDYIIVSIRSSILHVV